MRRRARIGLACVAALGASSLRAEVFEIGKDGAMFRSGHAAADVLDAEDAATDADGAAVDVPAGALTPLDGPSVPQNYRVLLADAARRYDVSPDLLAALVWRESRWQAAALSNKGAIGLGQLMPGTARALGVDPREPGANLIGAARYLRQMLDLFDGDVERALAAYNAGPARVLKANGIPPIAETRSYVAAIIDRLVPHGASASIGATP